VRDAKGRVLGHRPQPLRMAHSAISDNIPLVELHLLAYAEALEASSHATVDGAPQGSSGSDLWLLAVELMAASPESGRGFLVNLLGRQLVTRSIVRKDGALERRVDHRAVHRLLAIAARFGLDEEYNNVLRLAASLCVQAGEDALRRAASPAASGDA